MLADKLYYVILLGTMVLGALALWSVLTPGHTLYVG